MRWSSWRCRMHARCKNTQIQKSKYIVSTWCMYGEEGTRKMCRRRRGPAGASCVRCFIWHGDAPLSSHIPSLPCLFLFFLFLTFLSLEPAAACVFCFICQGMPLPVVHRPPTPIQPLPSLWQGAKKCLGWLYPQHVDWVPLSPSSHKKTDSAATVTLILSCLSGNGATTQIHAFATVFKYFWSWRKLFS